MCVISRLNESKDGFERDEVDKYLSVVCDCVDGDKFEDVKLNLTFFLAFLVFKLLNLDIYYFIVR
jgi:hypothetical protein